MDTKGWEAAFHRLRLCYPSFAALGRDLGYDKNHVQQVAKSLDNASENFKVACKRHMRRLKEEHVVAGEVATMALQAIERIREGEMVDEQVEAMRHRLQEKTDELLHESLTEGQAIVAGGLSAVGVVAAVVIYRHTRE